jgi:hypothetical protein
MKNWQPYEIEDGFLVVILDDQGKPIRKTCKCGGNKKTALENARRIAACINACEGIETEDLETRPPSTGSVFWLSKNFQKLGIENAALRQQNKELAEALKMMKKVTNVLGAGIGKIKTPDNFFEFWNDTEIMAAKAIAANAEPPNTQAQIL